VENGVVTLLSVEARKPGAPEGGEPRRTDVRAALKEELNTLLTAAERDRAEAAAQQ
jgi:hypothetical protein